METIINGKVIDMQAAFDAYFATIALADDNRINGSLTCDGMGLWAEARWRLSDDTGLDIKYLLSLGF